MDIYDDDRRWDAEQEYLWDNGHRWCADCDDHIYPDEACWEVGNDDLCDYCYELRKES